MRNSIPGILFGLWAIVHICIVSTFVAYAASDFRVPIYEIPEKLIGLYGLPKLTGVALLIVIICAFFTTAWSWLENRLKFDPFGLSRNNIKWSLNVLKRPLNLLPIIIPLLIMAYAFYLKSIYLLEVSVLVTIALILFVLPLAINREEVLASQTGRYWWIPAWPGWQPMISMLLIMVVGFMLQIIEFIITLLTHGQPAWQTIIPILLFWLLATFIAAGQAAVLINRTGPKEACKSFLNILKWRYVGPIIAFNIRLLYISTFMGITVASISILHIFVSPVYILMLRDNGQALPFYITWLTEFNRLIFQTYYMFVFFPFAIFFFLMIGRMVWRLGENRYE